MEKTVAPAESRRRNFTVTFWVLAAGGMVLFAMVTIPPGARRSRALRADLERARAVCGALRQKREAYLQCERALKTDPFFNEAVMRAKMKYRKPGEVEIKTGAARASFVPVRIADIPEFSPAPPPAAGPRERVVSWALLVACALLLAIAFLFFDRPALDRYGKLIPPGPV